MLVSRATNFEGKLYLTPPARSRSHTSGRGTLARLTTEARSTQANFAITWSHFFRQSGSFTFILDCKVRLDARSMARILHSTEELATNGVVPVRVHNDCNDVTNRSAHLGFKKRSWLNCMCSR